MGCQKMAPSRYFEPSDYFGKFKKDGVLSLTQQLALLCVSNRTISENAPTGAFSVL